MEKGPIDQQYPPNNIPGPKDLPPPYYPDLTQQNSNQQGPPPVGFQPPLFSQPASPQVVQMVQIMNLGSSATRMPCPHCGADIETRTTHEAGRMTHLAALILCLLCWPLVCVPYCMDDCMDVQHECPNCNKYIGSYKR